MIFSKWLAGLAAGLADDSRRRKLLHDARLRRRRGRSGAYLPQTLERRTLLTGSPPTFATSTHTFTTAEIPAGTSGVSTITIGTVSASDPDSTASYNDISYYTITAGDSSGNFWFGSNGELQTSSLDFEFQSNYTLSVKVVDTDGNEDTASVNVNVDDVPEDPSFTTSTYSFSVAEQSDDSTNTLSSTSTAGTVSATDPQSDVSYYTVTSGDSGGIFWFDTENPGRLMANGLDRESQASYVLGVKVVDFAGNENTATVNVTVTDVDEKPTAVAHTVDILGYAPETFNPASEATDPEGVTLTASIVTNPTYGTLTDNFDGTFTYVLTSATEVTSDSFTYLAYDGTNYSDNTETVSLNILWPTIDIIEEGYSDPSSTVGVGESRQ